MTNLKILMRKAFEHQQPLYTCFVDFKKAFDSISHDKLWVTMMDMEYPLQLIDLVEMVMRETLNGFQGRLQIGGQIRTFAMLMTSSGWPLLRQNYRSWWIA